jgi:predicted lipoprotein with Yx(FWY)xxD motif
MNIRPSRGPLAAAASILLLVAACGGSSGYGSSSSTTTSAAPPAAASGAALGTTTTSYGKVLVDTHGKTLYAFAIDSKGHSACTGMCLQFWPPVPAGSASPKAPAGVTGTPGALHRSDGSSQLTVNGFPMYTFSGDKKPGTTAGQGLNRFGGLWYVVAPDGSWIKASSGGSSMGPSSPPRGY